MVVTVTTMVTDGLAPPLGVGLSSRSFVYVPVSGHVGVCVLTQTHYIFYFNEDTSPVNAAELINTLTLDFCSLKLCLMGIFWVLFDVISVKCCHASQKDYIKKLDTL